MRADEIEWLEAIEDHEVDAALVHFFTLRSARPWRQRHLSHDLRHAASLRTYGPPDIGRYLRVRAFVFLTKVDRTSGVEGTHQVLPDTGEIPFRCSSSARAHRPVNFRGRLNMRPCGSIGAVRRLAACCLPARGTAVTAPLVAPVIPSGPARYGWCQNNEA